MRRTLLSVISLLLIACAAHADQVVLKNGDRLTGKIITGDGRTLLLRTEFAGDVSIKWDAITDIESSDNINITLKDGTRISGKITTQDGKFVVAAAPPAVTPSVAPKEIIAAVRNNAEQHTFDLATERMAHPRFYYFWSGTADTGLALTRGNSETASFTFAAKTVRETPRDKLTLYGNYIFANNSSIPPTVTTADALDAGIRGDLNIHSGRLFIFALGDFQTNQLQHLDLRSVFGGGFGYHLIKTANTTFDLFGGITYDRDSFGAYNTTNPAPPPVLLLVPSSVQNSAEAVLGEEFDTKLSKRTALTERFSFYPNLSHTGDYRFQLDSTLSTQISKWLSWHTTVSDRYISYPPAGLKGNDLLLSTGLRVIWGKGKQ